MLATINEAVGIGCSIMDTYFDRLDSRTLKKGDTASIDEEEDEEVAAGNFEAAANMEDFIIYESKDPYVLRSLPYLIGSQGYLENDHVGLKDLESEDEEVEEEEEEEVKDESSDVESSSLSEEDDEEDKKATKRPPRRDEDDDDDDDDHESEKGSARQPATTPTAVTKKPKKKEENLFEESDEDDDDGIFNLGGKFVKIFHFS